MATRRVISIREVDARDATQVEQLAVWNRQLQEDEGARALAIPAVRERLVRWLGSNYQALIFVRDEQAIGYALFRPNDPDQQGPGIYLRQFFITRENRRQGLATAAFELLVRQYAANRRIVLEVVASNTAGHKFWASLGFENYCTTYHLINGEPRP